jgi:hypothetical protein
MENERAGRMQTLRHLEAQIETEKRQRSIMVALTAPTNGEKPIVILFPSGEYNQLDMTAAQLAAILRDDGWEGGRDGED